MFYECLKPEVASRVEKVNSKQCPRNEQSNNEELPGIVALQFWQLPLLIAHNFSHVAHTSGT